MKCIINFIRNGINLAYIYILILLPINSISQVSLSPEINKIFFENSKFNQPIWLELPSESSVITFQQISQNPDLYESGIPSTSITMHTRNSLEDYDKYVLSFLIKNGYAKIESRIQTKHSGYGSTSKTYHFLFYSDEFKKQIEYFTVTQNFEKKAMPFIKLAKRNLISIDYKNEYEDAPLGMKRTFYSITFTYNIINELSGLPIINTVFKGKGKIFKDPDDGTWKMTGPFENLGITLNDNNVNEYKNILKNTFEPYKFENPDNPKSSNNNYTNTGSLNSTISGVITIDTSFAMFSFTFETIEEELGKESVMRNKILELLRSYQKIKENIPDEIDTTKISSRYRIDCNVKTFYNPLKSGTSTVYSADMRLSLYLWEIDKSGKRIKGTPAPNQLIKTKEFLGGTYISKQGAFDALLLKIQLPLYETLLAFFPAKSSITEITDANNKGEPKKVKISSGRNQGIFRTSKLKIIDPSRKNEEYDLEVSEIFDDYSICKVKNNESIIATRFKTKDKIEVTTIYSLTK